MRSQTTQITTPLAQDPQTLICNTAYTSPNYVSIFFGHLTIILALLYIFVYFVKLSKNLHLFPIRERAPYLTMIQCVSFWLSVLLLYITEVLILSNIDWEDDNTEVPFSRKFMKAFYIVTRLSAYFIMFLR